MQVSMLDCSNFSTWILSEELENHSNSIEWFKEPSSDQSNQIATKRWSI